MRALFIALTATGLAMLTLGCIADQYQQHRDRTSFERDRAALNVIIEALNRANQ